MPFDSPPQLRWIPFIGLLNREIHRFLKIVFQTIMTPLITVTLYILIFGASIGRELPSIDQYPYIAFLIPGLIMMSVIRNAFHNSAGSIITSKFCGEMDDFRIAPLSPTQIIWANTLASTLRGTLIGGLTLLIGVIFYAIDQKELFPFHHPFLGITFMVAGGLAYATLGLTISIFARTFDHVNAINTFVLLPLIYLGGVFFSIEHLHPFWQTVSRLNPLLYLVNGMRYSMLGISDIDVQQALLVTFGSLILFHLIAIWSLKKGSYHRW